MSDIPGLTALSTASCWRRPHPRRPRRTPRAPRGRRPRRRRRRARRRRPRPWRRRRPPLPGAFPRVDPPGTSRPARPGFRDGSVLPEPGAFLLADGLRDPSICEPTGGWNRALGRRAPRAPRAPMAQPSSRRSRGAARVLPNASQPRSSRPLPPIPAARSPAPRRDSPEEAGAMNRRRLGWLGPPPRDPRTTTARSAPSRAVHQLGANPGASRPATRDRCGPSTGSRRRRRSARRRRHRRRRRGGQGRRGVRSSCPSSPATSGSSRRRRTVVPAMPATRFDHLTLTPVPVVVPASRRRRLHRRLKRPRRRLPAS